MRRAFAHVIAYLLLGAVITTAVAWSCAYWGNYSGHWWSNEVWEQVGDDVRFARKSEQGVIYMYVSWWRPRAELRRVPDESPRGTPEALLPQWVPAPHEAPEAGGRLDHVWATGWPWPVLYYHKVEPWQDEPLASHIRGGILISSTPRANRMQLQYFPLIPVWPWFYLSSAIIGGLLFGVQSLFRINRGIRRKMFGRCPRCAYDLRGDLKSGCPECGWNRATKQAL
jgi:hypothetical protein